MDISSCAVASLVSSPPYVVWKLEVAVGEAEGSIEANSEATHMPALATVPSPGIRPAIEAAIPDAPANMLCRLKFRGVVGRG